MMNVPLDTHHPGQEGEGFEAENQDASYLSLIDTHVKKFPVRSTLIEFFASRKFTRRRSLWVDKLARGIST